MSLHERPQHALGERLLEFHLLEALGLDDELLEALLDDVFSLAARQAPGEQQDG
jgi:hypothetical protein